MFAPRPERVAAELARVLRSGGKLYMANWTPRGMPARMFKCLSAYVPAPAGFIPPVLWGEPEVVVERLDDSFSDIRMERKTYPQWHYDLGPAELVDFFSRHFGPVKRAFETLDAGERESLRGELQQIYSESSEVDDGRLTITAGEYLEVVATRR
jgi:hypothetical protein